MGTGKSTVGRLLAKALKMQHVDTDQLIERRHGPIPRIFQEQGESGFRDIERELAKELAADVGFVISTGGRFMLDTHNARLLSKGNRVFCLVADIDVIMDRVMRRRASRPMLAGPDPRARVLELMKEREAGYGAFEAVSTDERPPTQVVDEIISRLNAR
jgi:shikimate kinase